MTKYIGKEKIPAGIPENFVLATLHRPSNVDDPAVLAANLAFLTEVSEHCPVVLPLHPRAKATIDSFQLRPMIGPDVHLTEPFGYVQFLALLKRSRCVITDSGGIQEEATYLKKKCFTLRPNTERPSTVESGSNMLIAPENTDDRGTVMNFVAHPRDPDVIVPLLWDGHAGERIVQALS